MSRLVDLCGLDDYRWSLNDCHEHDGVQAKPGQLEVQHIWAVFRGPIVNHTRKILEGNLVEMPEDHKVLVVPDLVEP